MYAPFPGAATSSGPILEAPSALWLLRLVSSVRESVKGPSLGSVRSTTQRRTLGRVAAQGLLSIEGWLPRPQFKERGLSSVIGCKETPQEDAQEEAQEDVEADALAAATAG